ncbi:MAG: DUF1854 domain-containing protein [Candidatus Latescibacteria bacterium]|nr:DUF1854 domain-containing protein [Candidatus Latescibacterota bacterium]
MDRMHIEDEMDLLDPKELRMSMDAFGDLKVRLSGEAYKKVQALRAFPISEAMRFIALRDENGKEIGMIEDPGAMETASRKALKEELERRYFIPKVVRINRIDESYGMPRWDVQTDRGDRHFELQTRQDARRLSAGRVLIRDADGNRYEIPDVGKLDPKSRVLLEAEM